MHLIGKYVDLIPRNEAANSFENPGWEGSQSYKGNSCWSFPVIQKIGNVGIFVQLLMKINFKWQPVEKILMQIYICHDVCIKIEVIDNYIHLILKVKAIQKVQHYQFCVLWENLIQ